MIKNQSITLCIFCNGNRSGVSYNNKWVCNDCYNSWRENMKVSLIVEKEMSLLRKIEKAINEVIE